MKIVNHTRGSLTDERIRYLFNRGTLKTRLKSVVLIGIVGLSYNLKPTRTTTRIGCFIHAMRLLVAFNRVFQQNLCHTCFLSKLWYKHKRKEKNDR